MNELKKEIEIFNSKKSQYFSILDEYENRLNIIDTIIKDIANSNISSKTNKTELDNDTERLLKNLTQLLKNM